MKRKRKTVVVRVKRTRLKNGTKLRIYYWDDESANQRRKKGSHGKAQ